MDGKVVKLDKRMTGHLAWHNGVKEAESKAGKARERTTAKAGVAGTWFRAILVALAILATAIVFIVSGVGAVDREPVDEVRELRARMDKVIFQLDRLSRGKPGRGPS